MRPRSRFALTAMLLVASALTACEAREAAQPDDVIRVLEQGAPSAEHGAVFWTWQRGNDAVTWDRAKEFCAERDPATFPNCQPVHSLMQYEAALEAPSAESPGFDGRLMELDGRATEAQERLDSLMRQ